MESIYFNIILILAGIIVGGVVFLALLAPALGRTRDAEMHYNSRGINPGSILLLLLFFGLFALFTTKDFFSSASPILPKSEATLPQKQETPPFEKAMAKLNTKPAIIIEKESPPYKPPKAKGLTGYYWQLAAFSSIEKAMRLYDQIQINNGLQVHIVESKNYFGTSVFKVIIGDFVDKYDAEAFGNQQNIIGYAVYLREEENEQVK